MEQRINELIKQSRSYRLSDTADVICKVWNNGMGVLDLCYVDESDNVCYINSCLATKRDREKIAESFPEYVFKDVPYGYPDYYFHSFKYTAKQLWK